MIKCFSFCRNVTGMTSLKGMSSHIYGYLPCNYLIFYSSSRFGFLFFGINPFNHLQARLKKVLETKRLILREFTPVDAEKFYELNSDPEVIRHTGDSPFRTIDQARKFLADYEDYRKNGYGRWAVVEKSTHEFIGWCGLKLNEEGLVDIGFRFFRNYWGCGYATESASACLDYGFNTLKLNVIIGRSARANKASIRVLEKLNMSFWKTGSCEGIEDAVYYRKSKGGYPEEPGRDDIPQRDVIS